MIYSFLYLIITLLMLFIMNGNQRRFIIKKIPNKVGRYLFIIISLIILLILFLSDFINFFVIFAHFYLFIALIKIIIIIVEKINKKDLKINDSLISIVITLLYLSYGIYSVYNVVETKYNIMTDKKIENLRIVQISDSHVGVTFDGEGFSKYTSKINDINPDKVVITGDFVDDDTSKVDMVNSIKNLANIKTKYGIYFVFGNHDKGYFSYRNFSEFDLRMELKKNNIIVLEDNIVEIGNDVLLVGRQDKSVKGRKDISDLVKNTDKYVIVLDHQPNDYDNEAKANVELVLSGHTHGGQLIPLGPMSVLFKANDSYYGKKVIDNTTFIVNSGISCWALKFKTGSISEYGVIDIASRV